MIVAAVVAVVILSPAIAAAHSKAELDDWRLIWGRTVLSDGLTVDRLAEQADMARRHPWYFNRPVPHTHPRRTFSGGVEQWRGLVAAYFRAADVDRALRVMACESGGDPNVMHDYSNPASASGLMQHLGKYWSARSRAAGFAGASIFDPAANVATAAWLRDQPGGWSHWVCR